MDEHFRGDWFAYWRMPEYLIEMIIRFRGAENEASRIISKRWQRDYGGTNSRVSNSNRGYK